MNECPRDGNCFGCIDKGTSFCPFENDDLEEENTDIIRGRRLTDTESMRLMLPDLPMIDEKVLEEVLEPYMKV